MVAAAQRQLPDSTNGTPPYDAMDWQRKANAEDTHLWEVAATWLTNVAADATGNVITATSDTAQVVAIAAYQRPMAFWLVPTVTNQGGVTINIDAVGVKNIFQADGVSTLQAGDLTINKLYKIVYDGTNFRLFSASGGSANIPSVAPDLIVREEQTTNTGGGTATAGAFQARIFNTVVRNALAGASLNGTTGDVTLQAGSYYIEWSAPAFEVGNHLTRLQNITDGTTIETGTSEENATATTITTRSNGSTVLTITSAKAIELQHSFQTTKSTTGLGAPTNLGAKEVYAWLKVWRVGTLASQVNGVPGGAITFPYLIDTSSTADVDPGAGKLRFNNATQNAATVLRVNLSDANLTDETTNLDNLDISTSTSGKGYIRLVKYDDPTKWLLFKLTARATPTGYRNLTVVPVASSAASPFVADKVFFEFTQIGDKGDAGAAGANGTSDLGDARQIENCALSVTISGNAITIAVKDQNGADPSAGSPVKIAFRDTTAAGATWKYRTITAALSMTVSVGSTLGFANSESNLIHAGFIDNAGTVELAVSKDGAMWTEDRVVSTTAEGGAGAADSGTTLYSATARANVACRLAAAIVIQTGATAGNWSNAPTRVSNVADFNYTPFKNSLKSWISFLGTSGATGINDAFNVSSMVRNGAGDYSITFAVAMPTANYGYFGMGQRSSAGNNIVNAQGGAAPTPTAAVLRLTAFNDAGGADDSKQATAGVVSW